MASGEYEFRARLWLSDLGLDCSWEKYPLADGVKTLVVGALVMIYLNRYIPAKEILTVALTIAAALIAYRQWLSLRYENSIDKFYDRLEASNRRLEKQTTQNLLFDEVERKEFDSIMYIYGELDNLDYIVQKYANGFMGPEQAKRGIETFKARLREKKFRQWMCNFCIQNSGYCDLIHDVIFKLKEEICQEEHEKIITDRSKTYDFFSCNNNCRGPSSGRGSYKGRPCPFFKTRRERSSLWHYVQSIRTAYGR